MSTSYENKAARKRLPIVGMDGRGINTVHRVTASTTSTAFTVPAGWLGKWVRVLPLNCDAQLGFYTGSQAPTLTFNLTGSATGGSSGVSGSYSNGATFLNGIPEEGIVPSRAPRIWVSSSFSTFDRVESLPIVGCVYVCSTATSASIEFTVNEEIG